MKTALILLCLLVAAGAAWVRLAPSDPARWHVDPAGAAPGPGRYVAGPAGDRPALPGGADTLERLAALAEATPRTRLLAGSVAEGRITWITRSRLWGFPDYTTAALCGPDGAEVCIHARLRFGRDDLGVNRARVEGWLAALGG